MPLRIKICGIKTPDILKTCIKAKADFVGFVFFPPSPRNLEIDIAKELALQIPTAMRSIGLFVNPTDEELNKVLGHVPLDMIQLHGTETIERVKDIKSKYHMPIIKAFPVKTSDDIDVSLSYEPFVEWLLFDAKTPNAEVPGGTGKSFDWNLLKGKVFSKPWMLSGGLDADNIEDALSILSPDAVDVSSGVESIRGVKDPEKVNFFIETVKNNSNQSF